MNSLIVVNGEHDWGEYIPGIAVARVRLQSSRWRFSDGRLMVMDGYNNLTLAVEGVLWRVGAIRPQPAHRTALELIRQAGIPCVNPARTLLRGYDRLAMLNELREAGLPTIPFSEALGDGMLDTFQPAFPAVLKVGNYHAGLGKARIADEATWADACDLAFAADDYATIEPYIAYQRDIRCLAIGEQMWAMARRSVSSWKVNAGRAEYTLIEVPLLAGEYTTRMMERLEADILGLDFLETPDGELVCLEYNDIPGLSGFPDEARAALARRVRERLEA